MLDLAWLFVGAIATLVSLIAVSTGDKAIGIVTGSLGTIAWLLWSFGAFQGIETAQGTVFQMWPVAMFGLALSFIPAWVAIMGPLELINDAGERTIDEY